MTTIANPLDGADTLAHAQLYAWLGWRVIPIPAGLKRPTLERWQDVATTDPELICQWWERWPTHGIGLVTGPGSGVLALDVDPAHGGDDTLAALEAAHGKLPDTVEAITGGNGRHLLFAWPSVSDGTVIANSAGKLGPGLDIRGEGGQIVVAPSIHPNGNAYQWEASSRPGEVPLATVPAWLLGLLLEQRVDVPDHQVSDGDHRFAWDRYEASGNAEAVRLLTGAGWHSPRTGKDGVVYMTRPGKAPGHGQDSASIGKVRPGVVHCFTGNAPPLEADRGYRLPDLAAALFFQGDRALCDRALVEAGWGAATYPSAQDRAELMAWFEYQHAMVVAARSTPAAPEAGAAVGNGPTPIVWPDFWTRERRLDDWAIPQVVPAGRLVTVWAARKTGKSLFVLDIAAAAATGRPILGGTAIEPIDVVYLDLEMTEDDLEERLGDLGYGPEDDLSRFHYYLLPHLPPLDTDAGGDALMAIVERHSPQVVVLDTMARVIEGEENSADTYRAFYRTTGMRLKQAGVAMVRLDHAGKQKDKGERGSSAKGDDVDLSWELRDAGNGEYVLNRSYTRISWAPESIKMTRETEPRLRHNAGGQGGGSPAGVLPCAQDMDELGLPLDVTLNPAQRALQNADKGRKRAIIAKAIAYRKENAERVEFLAKWPAEGRELDREPPNGQVGNHLGNHPEPVDESPGQSPEPPREPPGTEIGGPVPDSGSPVWEPEGGTEPGTAPMVWGKQP